MDIKKLVFSLPQDYHYTYYGHIIHHPYYCSETSQLGLKRSQTLYKGLTERQSSPIPLRKAILSYTSRKAILSYTTQKGNPLLYLSERQSSPIPLRKAILSYTSQKGNPLLYLSERQSYPIPLRKATTRVKTLPQARLLHAHVYTMHNIIATITQYITMITQCTTMITQCTTMINPVHHHDNPLHHHDKPISYYNYIELTAKKRLIMNKSTLVKLPQHPSLDVSPIISVSIATQVYTLHRSSRWRNEKSG